MRQLHIFSTKPKLDNSFFPLPELNLKLFWTAEEIYGKMEENKEINKQSLVKFAVESEIQVLQEHHY